MQPTVNQSVIKRYKKRCLIGFQKGVNKGLKRGTFCKPKGRLLEAQRACIGFELNENSLQTSSNKEIKLFVKTDRLRT